MESTHLGFEPMIETGLPREDGVRTPRRIEWTPGRLCLILTASDDHPVVLSGIGSAGAVTPTSTTQPIAEVIATGDGRARTTTRFTNTGVGSRLRYVDHSMESRRDEERLSIVQADATSGLRVTTTFTTSPLIRAARVTTTVHNGSEEPVVLEAVSSLTLGAVVYPGESTKDLFLHSGTGEQLAENRWTARPLWSQTALADINSGCHGQPGRGSVEAIGTSTWSTARALPTGVLENSITGRSIAWQIEHNGGWRWEVDNLRDGEDSVAIVLLGPEDVDHQWAEELATGETFTSVPVSIAVAESGFIGVVAELTRHRRWLRRERNADRGSLLVYNDFMNTLNGNPTTERLLPLISAAASVGASAFVSTPDGTTTPTSRIGGRR
jgi:alpha-galactosidase